MRDTNTFVCNITPENWPACRDGPASDSDHPVEHREEPWHGVPANSSDAAAMAKDMQPDDIVLPRIEGEGFAGVWILDERAPVDEQAEVPWTDRAYSAVLYCRPLHRELDSPYIREFDTVRSGHLQGAVVNLPATSPPLKRELLEGLLGTGRLDAPARRRLEQELTEQSPTIDATADADPRRVATTATRVVRDTEEVTALKTLYDHTCQVCGDRRQRNRRQGYAEGHHLEPLGEPHDGPDAEGNLLVVCPNHHADFDHGTITVEPETLTIRHQYESALDGRSLYVTDGHDLETSHLEYHHEQLWNGSA
jgi:hypothetical protein